MKRSILRTYGVDPLLKRAQDKSKRLKLQKEEHENELKKAKETAKENYKRLFSSRSRKKSNSSSLLKMFKTTRYDRKFK